MKCGCTRVALLAGPFTSTCLGSVALCRGRVCGHCCLATVSASTAAFRGMGKLRPHQTTGLNNRIWGLFPRAAHWLTEKQQFPHLAKLNGSPKASTSNYRLVHFYKQKCAHSTWIKERKKEKKKSGEEGNDGNHPSADPFILALIMDTI